MIRPADGECIKSIKADDAFYTRILSLYLCYGDGYGFVAFWAQEVDGETVALISRFEDKFSLYLTAKSDLDEIAAFLSFQGAGSAMYDSSYGLGLSGVHAISGDVLEYTGDDYISDKEIYRPEFKEIYDMLRTCESDIFRVPDYMMFLSDLTRRRNAGRLSAGGILSGGALASTAVTVSETDSSAILGAVATRPEYRRKGLSRELVRTMATELRAGGKRVFVLSASEANTRFYKNSGFEISAGFREIFFR